MVLVQKWLFFQLLFLANLDQENVFYDILERKNAFLRYKNTKFKKSKNWHFSQGVNLWFWSKNGHFSNFFLGNLDQENVFYDILEQKKTAFLRYKNKKSKKPKNWQFSKGVNSWFRVRVRVYFLGDDPQGRYSQVRQWGLCKRSHYPTFFDLFS